MSSCRIPNAVINFTCRRFASVTVIFGLAMRSLSPAHWRSSESNPAKSLNLKDKKCGARFSVPCRTSVRHPVTLGPFFIDGKNSPRSMFFAFRAWRNLAKTDPFRLGKQRRIERKLFVDDVFVPIRPFRSFPTQKDRYMRVGPHHQGRGAQLVRVR